MIDNICPVCGSDDIKETFKEEIFSEPFGGNKQINIKESKCISCGSTGDFFNDNETLIDNTIKELKQNSVVNILNNFSNNRISMSAIERALDLPQRTLAKWKNGNSSRTERRIALLRLIRIFPWLLEVAENKFDYNYSQKIYINAAVNKLLSVVDFKKDEFAEAGLVTTSKSAFIYLHFEKKEDTSDDIQYIFPKGNFQPLLTTL